jgi:plastocyanin
MATLRITIATTLLALSLGCGSSYSPSTPSPTPSPSPSPTPSPSGGVAASIVSGARNLTTTAYAPNPIAVAVGGTVTWTNGDTITHTSTGDGGTWDSGNIAPGATFSRTFSSAGSFRYHCTLHPGMIGTVNVQ